MLCAVHVGYGANLVTSVRVSPPFRWDGGRIHTPCDARVCVCSDFLFSAFPLANHFRFIFRFLYFLLLLHRQFFLRWLAPLYESVHSATQGPNFVSSHRQGIRADKSCRSHHIKVKESYPLVKLGSFSPHSVYSTAVHLPLPVPALHCPGPCAK